MLWNLGLLEREEKCNHDFKQLIDNLRTYGLMPYYLSSEYHEDAKQELAKVNWELQPKRVRRQYKKPLMVLKFENTMKMIGAEVKQKLFSRK